MQLGQVIRGIYLHCQRIMASLASSMLMHLHADLQINAMAAEKKGRVQTALSALFEMNTGIGKSQDHRTVIFTPLKLQIPLSERFLKVFGS